MVHDEEAEVSIHLTTLIANTQRTRSAGQTPVDTPGLPAAAATHDKEGQEPVDDPQASDVGM